jgi:hypothetical protein
MLGRCRKKAEEFVALCNLSLVVLIITPKLHSLLYGIESYKRKTSDLPSAFLKYHLLLPACLIFLYIIKGW